MSIKDNIKEEMLKRIEQRELTCIKLHNQDIELMNEFADRNDNMYCYHEGHINATDDELVFLDKLKAFIKTL